MAELIGLLTSILQLISTIQTAATLIKDLHNAPKEQQRLFSEIRSLQPLIAGLQDRVRNSREITGIQQIGDPLYDFEHLMKECSRKLQAGNGRLSKASKSMAWMMWNKQEAKEDLDKVEHFKSLVNTWLTVDIWDSGQQQWEEHAEQHREHDRILASVQDVAHAQRRQSDAAECERIIEWMSSINSFKRQADIFSAWQPGTGDWLFASSNFRYWEASSGKILWCRGMPGAGKTVLASLVVNHLTTQSHNKNIGVACVYLNHKETESQTVQNILGALWRQLILEKSIPAAVKTFYKDHSKRGTQPSRDQFLQMLALVIAEYAKVYLVVDALDECLEERRDYLLEALTSLAPSVNLVLTSRPHINLDPFLGHIQILEIHATEGDIQHYVEKQILKSRKLSKHIHNRPELQEEILSKIISNAEGMFLLAKLHIDSLTTKNTVKAVREALHQLPKDLNHTYDEAMERIDNQSEDDRQLAQQVLTWVSNVKRPLSVGELREALAIEPEATTLDPDNLLDMDTVVSVCAGLIMVDEKSSVVRLIHYTTQDYLNTFQTERFSNAHTEILSGCLTYLAFKEFLELPKARPVQNALVVQHPFLKYSQYCLLHAVGQPEIQLQERTRSFVNHASHRWYHFWKSHLGYLFLVSPWQYSRWHWRYSGTPLCIAAASNLKIMASHLLANEMTSISNIKNSALCAASYSGHLEMVQLLIEHGADVNLQAWNGARLQGTSVQAQSQRQIKNSNPGYGNALQAASAGGHASVVHLLIQKGANVNAQGGYYGTALQEASSAGHYPVVQLLITNGADVNMEGGKYGTALQAASAKNHEATVELLLDNHALVNKKGGTHGTALQAASANGHQRMVTLLIEHGADGSVVSEMSK
ncbi:hypothetical protein C8R44DRAFT_224838 [Mycena epipterygia]|nr:hypothetical protein C8R44DRAFT_224838 [Mycena epipterygia]